MYAATNLLNKKHSTNICQNCLIRAIEKSKDISDDCSDICTTISRTQTLEQDTIERLHKLNSIIEESNNLVA
jgi:hypothetical protein